MQKLPVVVIALTLMLCFFPVLVLAKEKPSALRSKTKLVRIYFYRYDKAKNYEFLKPVWRRVSADTPARGVLMALFKGPSAREKELGFGELDSKNLHLRRLSIRNGVARVDFVTNGNKSWAGDMAAGHFYEAVTESLKQFPSVRKTQVSVDGDGEFYALMP